MIMQIWKRFYYSVVFSLYVNFDAYDRIFFQLFTWLSLKTLVFINRWLILVRSLVSLVQSPTLKVKSRHTVISRPPTFSGPPTFPDPVPSETYNLKSFSKVHAKNRDLDSVSIWNRTSSCIYLENPFKPVMRFNSIKSHSKETIFDSFEFDNQLCQAVSKGNYFKNELGPRTGVSF